MVLYSFYFIIEILCFLVSFEARVSRLTELGGGGWNQAYSRLSTTHGHITDCKLDSVVCAGVTNAGELMWTCLVWAE